MLRLGIDKWPYYLDIAFVLPGRSTGLYTVIHVTPRYFRTAFASHLQDLKHLHNVKTTITVPEAFASYILGSRV